MDFVECVVIGAGAVGLAIARDLAMGGHDTVILESQRTIGSGISSRSSEVIHAGLYYEPDSLKARFCVAGRDRLYAYCRTNAVGHRRCGKLVVATREDQTPQLDRVYEAARRNGVDDVRMIDAAEALRMEGELSCVAAIVSPSTGLLDSHGYMLSLQGDAEAHSAVTALRAEVADLTPLGGDIAVWLRGEDQPSLRARLVVNAAGLGSNRIANAVARRLGKPERPLYYAKGSYFALQGRSPFSRLIYPVPEAHGLGVHLTLDLAGQTRFGPDVEWVETPDYAVDPARAEVFYAAVRAYWPALKDGALIPAYSGVRPKLNAPGDPSVDFKIDVETDAGGTLINLIGIESPGLTSSLAIADHVTTLAHGMLS
jgi:L-2-hydroxyglutarate oxidase LhgO